MKSILLVISLFFTFAFCVDIQGIVLQPPTTVQSGAAISILGAIPEPVSIRVLLDGGARIAMVSSRDGSFIFENVTVGQHALEVAAPGALYASMVVDVSDRIESAVEFHYAGAAGLPARLPLAFAPLLTVAPFDAKPPSMFWGMASNPMVIFGGVALLLMLFVQSQDPEEMKAM